MSSLDAAPEDAPTLNHRSTKTGSSGRRESGAFKWWVVVMLWFVCFLNNGDRQAISAIFPKLQQLYHFDTVQLGLIGSAFMWVYAIGSPISGYIGDRLKRKNLILGGCAFWSFITITTGWCSQLWQFITVRALVGAGETLYFPASMSLISDYHGPETRSKAMSFHQSSVYAGTIIGTWITALLAEKYRWQLGFYLFGSLGIALAFVLFFFLREPERGRTADATPPPPGTESEVSPTTEAPPSVREVALHIFSKPTAILLMLAFMGANFVSTIFTTWTPKFLVDKFHFSLSHAGLSGSAFIFVACAFGSPIGGILADRFSRRLMGGRMLVQAGGLLFGSVFVFLIGTTSQVSTLLTAMFCFGFGKGLYDSNIFASIYDVIEPRARSTAAGLMNTVAWAGGAMGPLVVGWIAKYGKGTEVENMSWAMAKTGIVYILSATLLLLVAFVTVHWDSTRRGA